MVQFNDLSRSGSGKSQRLVRGGHCWLSVLMDLDYNMEISEKVGGSRCSGLHGPESSESLLLWAADLESGLIRVHSRDRERHLESLRGVRGK